MGARRDRGWLGNLVAPLVAASAICAIAGAVASCGAGSADDGRTGGRGGAGAGNGAGGEAGSAGAPDASVGDALFEGGGGSGGGAPVCPTCSADLKSVLDCDGSVILTCPDGVPCSGGACGGDPCIAAESAKTSFGCEYWAMNLDDIMFGACFAAYVVNTWSAPIHIQVEYAGMQLPIAQFARIPTGQGAQLTYAPYDPVVGLPSGQVAILFLAQTPQLPAPVGCACPAGITTALAIDPAVHGTGIGQGFHITTDGPIVAYQVFPYGGGNAAITSESLLLPTSAWDVNYVAVNGYAKSTIPENWGQPSLDVLANEDGTVVTISPVAAIAGGPNVQGTPAGQPISYYLNRGQFLQISQDAELTGSAILATKPVAVFGGSSCMNIPTGTSACDTAGQQIPPVRALGHEYAAVRYRGRAGGVNEQVPWRIVGAADGTQLTWTPSAPPGAPLALATGQAVEFQSPGPFLVASQDADHPFYLAGHMTGGELFGGEGDPEFVNVVPTEQYLKQYVFFTDPTYPETNLVLVRAAGANGFEDVSLDCAGVVGGWQPLGPYEWTRVDLVTGNFQSVNGCSNGRHLIESKGPFGLTVWGWGSNLTFPFTTSYVSYAYPAGAGVAPINTTVVPPTPR
jgi:hypothetical protein